MKRLSLYLVLFALAGCGSGSPEATVEGQWYGQSKVSEEDFTKMSEGMEDHLVTNLRTVIASEICDLNLREDGTYEMWGKWIMHEEGTWEIFAGQVMITPTMRKMTRNHDAVLEEVTDPVKIGISIDESEDGESTLSTGELVTRKAYTMVFTRERPILN